LSITAHNANFFFSPELFDIPFPDKSQRERVVVQAKRPRPVAAAARQLASDALVAQVVHDQLVRMESLETILCISFGRNFQLFFIFADFRRTN
jgi:hypothetical protein